MSKIGFCWHCGALTCFRCARCLKFVCVLLGSPVPAIGCARLVKAPKQIGVYRLVCWPKCVKRRHIHAIERIADRIAEQGGDDR